MIFNDNKAIYIQIADRIMDEIIDGKYPPCQRIPSVREYAASLEVNANTVMRSYEMLERLEIIFNRRGIGFFVAEKAVDTITGIRKKVFYSEELPYFFSRLAAFGVTPQELIQNYQSYISNTKK